MMLLPMKAIQKRKRKNFEPETTGDLGDWCSEYQAIAELYTMQEYLQSN